ncbi:MAG: hypothetical protein A4E46_00693 [Methanosaeta sp. PtaU1.Bin016]|nr:MAG: hypothetical protein A4E46_00693 [Methanosaeta sp. PtaU1.Bin016]
MILRTSRAYPVHSTKIRESIMLVRPDPRKPMTARAKKMLGKAKNASTTRIIVSSRMPPKYPAVPPKNIPRIAEKSTTPTPIKRDILMPNIIRLKMQRPKWSVPSGYSQSGDFSRSSGIAFSGSWGAIHPARRAPRTRHAMIKIASLHPRSVLSFMPQPRIEVVVTDVHQQIQCQE